VQLQLLQLGFWLLVMVWNFFLCYGLDYFLSTLALERDMLSWLAIGFKVCCLSRLKVLGGGFDLWLGDNIAILSMEK
jgi:hypothetical protein